MNASEIGLRVALTLGLATGGAALTTRLTETDIRSFQAVTLPSEPQPEIQQIPYFDCEIASTDTNLIFCAAKDNEYFNFDFAVQLNDEQQDFRFYAAGPKFIDGLRITYENASGQRVEQYHPMRDVENETGVGEFVFTRPIPLTVDFMLNQYVPIRRYGTKAAYDALRKNNPDLVHPEILSEPVRNESVPHTLQATTVFIAGKE